MHGDERGLPKRAVDRRQRKTVVRALIYQFPFLALTLLVTDGGRISRICFLAAFSFWVGVLVMVLLRIGRCNETDSHLVLYGY